MTRRHADPEIAYWAQLPFAVINHALMAAHWFAQAAPPLFHAVIGAARRGAAAEVSSCSSEACCCFSDTCSQGKI